MRKKIGVLGGGQLAMMLKEASLKLDIDLVCYENVKGTSASFVTDVTVGDYFDERKLSSFVESCNVLTFETENIPRETIEYLKIYGAVHPRSDILYMAQDRILEKNFVKELGIPTTTFHEISSEFDIQNLPSNFSFPAILKTRTGGYDGKGQIPVCCLNELVAAWHVLDRFPAILESKVDFEKEYSLIAARNIHGETVFYPLVENFHYKGIIRLTKGMYPNDLSSELQKKAENNLKLIMEKMNYVGVLAVEFFLSKNGELLFNEMAPRVHNSGHFTMNGCNVSQFENHLRAICGMELITPKIKMPTIMVNWIGDTLYQKVKMPQGVESGDHQIFHHDYRKTILPNRKVGHTNIVFNKNRDAELFYQQMKEAFL